MSKKNDPIKKALAKPKFHSVTIKEAWDKWRRKKNGQIIGNNGGFILGWNADKIGFGEITFFKTRAGRLEIRSEYMGRAFVKQALDHFLKHAKVVD